MEFLLIITLNSHCWVWWWKNFENWSTLAKLMGKNQVGVFFWTQCM